jgi:hypothetical protein
MESGGTAKLRRSFTLSSLIHRRKEPAMSDWYQQALTPPDVVELRIRLGLIPTQEHAQGLVELLDPVTGILIAQYSVPHRPMANWPSLLEELYLKAGRLLADSQEPF